MLITTRSMVLIFSLAVIVLGASVGHTQNYPGKPIRIYTGNAGGGNDAAARLIAQGISGPLGQPVIVENRGGVISVPIVAQAPPDGYSLLFGGDLLWLGPLLQGQSDPIRDFSPISMLASAPFVFVVHPSLPVKSVRDLIALAKARPGQLNYATSGSGGIDHLGMELFRSMTGIDIVRVNYKSGSQAVVGLLSGEVHMSIRGTVQVSTNIKLGKLKALAVTSAQPSALVVGLPTMAASGLPGYELVGTDAMYAPAKTPAAIINQLNREIVRFVKTPEASEKYLNLGAEIVGSSPEEHIATLKSRIAIMGKLIRDAGIKAE